jgi:membrane fusion protein (multidrug efflux system)
MSAETLTQESPLAVEEPAEPPQKTRRVNPVVLGIVLIVLIAAGTGWYFYSSGFEDTDDAQVDGHLNPIASRIDGTIKAVHVDDNQAVQAGELLVELDPSDDQISLHQAQAQYDQAMALLGAAHPNLPITRIGNTSDLTSQQAEVAGAEAALAAAQHDLDSVEAKLKESQAVNDRSQADFARYQALYDKQEVSRADYDQFKATAAAQTQTVASNQAERSFRAKDRGTAHGSARAAAQQAEADRKQRSLAGCHSRGGHQESAGQRRIRSGCSSNRAELNLTYCRIIAPVSGVITQRSAEVGARISKGQQLFMIVQTGDLWVTANFKETQLARIHSGQHVRIHVDALHVDFDGTVESMPAVTGSRTSVLPPENATGNYVKVIQRLPVRIRFNGGQKDLEKLRPGMSVEPKVHLD